MQTFIAGQLARLGAGGTADGPTAQDGAVQSAASNAAAGISGEVRSRADVSRALDRICDYYRRTEPASPIPLLLERARRLIDKDFMAILRDLTPGGLSEAEVFAGREQQDD
jgi:type VI secretion system protein ImpA